MGGYMFIYIYYTSIMHTHILNIWHVCNINEIKKKNA